MPLDARGPTRDAEAEMHRRAVEGLRHRRILARIEEGGHIVGRHGFTIVRSRGEHLRIGSLCVAAGGIFLFPGNLGPVGIVDSALQLSNPQHIGIHPREYR
jgi:hypothetical protein